MTTQKETMIERFQCPGCIRGNWPQNCKDFVLEERDYGFCCKHHTTGTALLQAGHMSKIALGMPKGFNKTPVSYNAISDMYLPSNKMIIWMLLQEDKAKVSEWFDHLNIPVWAMVQDGFLFVRVYSPRIDQGRIYIIEGGDFDLFPPRSMVGVYDVESFYDDID